MSLVKFSDEPQKSIQTLLESHLYLTKSKEPIADHPLTKVYDFALSMLASTSSGGSFPKDKLAFFGKLIFLFESPLLCDAINRMDVENAENKISELFIRELKKKDQRRQAIPKQENVGIQMATSFDEFALAFDMANLLVTPSGQINYLLIASMSDILSSGTPYEKEMSVILYLLNETDHAKKLLERIFAPKQSLQQLINLAIRIDLRLPYNEPLADVDAKKALFATLLSHLSKGPLAQMSTDIYNEGQKKNHLFQVIRDLSNLIENGSLVRPVNNLELHFDPLITAISDPNRDKTLYVDNNGKISGTLSMDVHLWDVPGMIAACTYWNITNHQKTLLSLLKQQALRTTTISKVMTFKVQDLLSKLEKFRDPATSPNAGYLAFTGQTQNLLFSFFVFVLKKAHRTSPKPIDKIKK